jgi:Holliday junction resolvasome RuvABC ATP-dependent DNA helicase subunit
MEYLQPLSDVQINSEYGEIETNSEYGEIETNSEYGEIETNSEEIILDFSEIVGYEDIKKLLTKAVKSDSPVHVLISGPPSSSKTVFLMALQKSLGSSCHFIDGVSASKSGFVNYVMNTTSHPKYILIDELDKMERADQPVLLNVLETGILQETKFKRARRMDLKDTWFFCTSNDNSKIIDPLLSRFYILEIPPYTPDQFHHITTILLTEKYGKNQEVAEEISTKVWKYLDPATIRDCVRFAKLRDTIEDINWLIEIDKKYSKNKYV